MALASSSATFKTLETLKFDNLNLRALPVDPDTRGDTPRSVAGACFSRVKPTPVHQPSLVVASAEALGLIDIGKSETERGDFAEYLSGNKLIPGTDPAAHCYCGFQFGYFSGQLGDGATMYLGEVINSKNERWEIQFKGAGKTPYSRQADGRKVLRSSLREFFCSEAMHHLGIPTTRAGSVVTSKTEVMRDLFYTGDFIYEKASIVLRLAPTFLRFGSFEIARERDRMTGREGPSSGQTLIIKNLVDHTISTYFPHVESASEEASERHRMFFAEVVERTAELAAGWQSVGFCHGVLNTDNMSIVGLTIDYGPFGFMERFDRGHICNTSDNDGRYAYDQQPEICAWNLMTLAESLRDVIPIEVTKKEVGRYDGLFLEAYLTKMRRKFGFVRCKRDEDAEIVKSFFETMQATGADFTRTFRSLSKIQSPPEAPLSAVDPDADEEVTILAENSATIAEMIEANKPTIPTEKLNILFQLAEENPMMLRQIDGAHALLMKERQRRFRTGELLKMTEDQKREKDRRLWGVWLDGYRRRLFTEMEGLSRAEAEVVAAERVQVIRNSNPSVVLRNWMAQVAIEAAEKGDNVPANELLELLRRPFEDHTESQRTAAATASSTSDDYPRAKFLVQPPPGKCTFRVSCSS